MGQNCIFMFVKVFFNHNERDYQETRYNLYTRRYSRFSDTIVIFSEDYLAFISSNLV